MTPTELQDLCHIGRAAGAAIMDVYAQERTVYYKADQSPVTDAALRADRIIREALERRYPDICIWSEESRSTGCSQPDAFFLVDPLDGTKEFIQRSGEFTVNIARIEHGHVTAGMVFAPALNQMFYAAVGAGAWKDDPQGQPQAIYVKPAADNAMLRVLGSRSHGTHRLQAALTGLQRPYRFVPAGSSLKFCRIAEGRADLYPRFGPTAQWDTAAAQCVLEQAGGQVLDSHGRALRYGLDKPLLNGDFCATALTWPEVEPLMVAGRRGDGVARPASIPSMSQAVLRAVTQT